MGVGLSEIKANSAQFQVKLPTGAELGNTEFVLLDNEGLESVLSDPNLNIELSVENM